MDPGELARRFPRLYHVAEADAWESIIERGLLSTEALCDLFEVEGEARERILRSRRPRSVVLEHPQRGRAMIRDQRPLQEKRLLRCLQGMTAPEYYELLNSMTFFWPSEGRLERLLGAGLYRDRSHAVFVVATADLVERHEERIRLSPYNSGAVNFDPPPRGPETFLSIAEYPYDSWRSRRSPRTAIAEVAVEYQVRDIAEIAIEVRVMGGGRNPAPVWRRPHR